MLKSPSIFLPLSRFRREMRGWMRHLGAQPDDVILVTRKGEPYFVVMSSSLYETSQKRISKAA